MKPHLFAYTSIFLFSLIIAGCTSNTSTSLDDIFFPYNVDMTENTQSIRLGWPELVDVQPLTPQPEDAPMALQTQRENISSIVIQIEEKQAQSRQPVIDKATYARIERARQRASQ